MLEKLISKIPFRKSLLALSLAAGLSGAACSNESPSRIGENVLTDVSGSTDSSSSADSGILYDALPDVYSENKETGSYDAGHRIDTTNINRNLDSYFSSDSGTQLDEGSDTFRNEEEIQNYDAGSQDSEIQLDTSLDVAPALEDVNSNDVYDAGEKGDALVDVYLSFDANDSSAQPNDVNQECNEYELRESYSGDFGTMNVGNCRSKLERCINGEYIVEREEVLPNLEICDNQDNDCDGQFDEDYNVWQICSNGIGECVSEGVLICSANNLEVMCNAIPKDPREDLCGCLDNNCDGEIDCMDLHGTIVFSMGWLYTMDTNGCNKNNLNVEGGSPMWSPDGTKIVFRSNGQREIPGAGISSEIYVMDSNGENITQLTDTDAFESGPKWSPNGTKITFDTLPFNSHIRDIYIIDADGRNLRNITNNTIGNYDFSPSWSPDGSKIVVSSRKTIDNEVQEGIYIINIDGSNRVRLTNQGTNDFPSWSPDGTKIVFSSNREGNYEIYIMNSDGSEQTNIANNPSHDYYPIWSPDGTKILFTSERIRETGLYVMNLDGSNLRLLTHGGRYASWKQ